MTRPRSAEPSRQRRAPFVAAAAAALLLTCGTAMAQSAAGTTPANPASAARSGADVYAAVCAACHATSSTVWPTVPCAVSVTRAAPMLPWDARTTSAL